MKLEPRTHKVRNKNSDVMKLEEEKRDEVRSMKLPDSILMCSDDI